MNYSALGPPWYYLKCGGSFRNFICDKRVPIKGALRKEKMGYEMQRGQRFYFIDSRLIRRCGGPRMWAPMRRNRTEQKDNKNNGFTAIGPMSESEREESLKDGAASYLPAKTYVDLVQSTATM